jgi:hypothetical protein
MVANQTAIALDSKTVMLKAAYNFGSYGTITLQGSDTSADDENQYGDNDYQEVDLVYKVKAGGVDYLLAYVNQSWDRNLSEAWSVTADGTGSRTTGKDSNQLIRFWARYNF